VLETLGHAAAADAARLLAAFNQVDVAGAGVVAKRDAALVAKALSPQATPASLAAFQAIVDLQPDALLSAQVRHPAALHAAHSPTGVARSNRRGGNRR
jgi:hypothetical protein